MAGHNHKLEIFRGRLKFKSNVQKIWGVLVFLSIITIVEVALGIIKPEILLNYFLGIKLINWIFIILTIVKAYYITWDFMHVRDEKPFLKNTIESLYIGDTSYPPDDINKSFAILGVDKIQDSFDRSYGNIRKTQIGPFVYPFTNYTKKTIADFYEKEQNGIHSIFEQNLSKTKERLVELKCKRMDTYITEKSLDIPDLVKIDVEGATLEALKSFGGILEDIKILQIETEEVEYFTGQTLEPKVMEYLYSDHFYPFHCPRFYLWYRVVN